ncbi:AI-2E family transporter [Brevibacterium spongiae]|uniref:AI-2E family transporter n=1 Tax=Brevibacterium spongiae TaxID=2909672 RepID=A0ABY5SSB0_9MICO|nr:AI-2E family transporter [Brevibacterium spongiae]UVI37455.1 AI-2E family transporter [Brevibacterium spongiae]
MTDNEQPQSPNRFRGAWEAFRRGRDSSRSQPEAEVTPSRSVSPEEIALSRIEAEAKPYVSPGLKLAAAWSWRSIVVLIAIGVAFWLLSKISSVVLPVLIALLLAALLAPFTGWMVKKGLPRGGAAAIAFIGFIVVVLGLFALVGQQIYSGMPDLVKQVIAGVSGISSWLATSPFGIDSSTISSYIDNGIKTATNFFQNNSSQLLGGALEATSSVGTFLTGLVVCLFTTFFFLYDGQNIFKWVMGLLPIPARPVATGAALKGWTTLVQYVRVQILVAAVDAIGIGIGAAFLGIPLVIPMTVLVFLTSFVPVVGAIASGAVAVLVALVSNGLVSAVIMLAVVIAVQQIESQVLQPFLMGKAVSVHPLAVILAVTGGGFLFGIVGALFAVPAVAVLNSVVSYIVRADSGDHEKDSSDDPSPDDPKDREATAVLERAEDRLTEAVHDAADDDASAAGAAGSDASAPDSTGGDDGGSRGAGGRRK